MVYSKVLLSDYLNILSPKQSDKMNFNLSLKENVESIPFLGRSANNNGIVDYVFPEKALINEGNILTIALDGSTGSTFYQHHEFSSGQNIWLLQPKEEFFKYLNPAIMLFLVTTIRKAVKGFSWNLSLTKTRLLTIKILLPLLSNGEVDLDFISNNMSELRNINFISNIPFKRM